VMSDNCRARDLDSEGHYHRRAPASGEPELDSQLSVLESLRRRGLRAVQPD